MRGATSRLIQLPYQVSHFNPRAPCGARLSLTRQKPPSGPFQSTRPLRGATTVRPFPAAGDRISIHAPLAGRDPTAGAQRQGTGISIHAPLAGRDGCSFPLPLSRVDFNPRAPCGARLRARRQMEDGANFNPRAPCGARLLGIGRFWPNWISIHAPLAGRDFLRVTRVRVERLFQSTRPLRGATTARG